MCVDSKMDRQTGTYRQGNKRQVKRYEGRQAHRQEGGEREREIAGDSSNKSGRRAVGQAMQADLGTNLGGLDWQAGR